jgi:hypothetical protein
LKNVREYDTGQLDGVGVGVTVFVGVIVGVFVGVRVGVGDTAIVVPQIIS